MSQLTLDKIYTAGWFQWLDLEARSFYPECHVLVYKIAEDYFVSEVIDFGWIASGKSSQISFDALIEISLENFKVLKQQLENTMDFSQSALERLGYPKKDPEFWNHFRELYIPKKLASMMNSNPDTDAFPFDLYQENIELRIKIETLTKQSDDRDEIIELLRGMLNELQETRRSERVEKDLIEV